MTTTGKRALVIGATGLVGAHIVQQLLDDPRYAAVVTLVRRPLSIEHPKLKQEIIDFDRPDPSAIKGDELFCALGTTLAKAGSKEAQYRIDCAYPAEIGRIARANGVQRYLLVSSVGADAGSGNFYLRTKGDLEEQIKSMGFELFASARPSFLLGQRAEFRLGERIGIAVANVVGPLLLHGPLRKYKGIQAAQVAAALIRAANEDKRGVFYLEYDALMA